jgi:copper chaperone CopZ
MTARSLAAALTAVLLVSPRAAHAQIEEVKITVDGLSCNLCAAGLDRSLRRVEGIASVRVVLASQVATVTVKPGARVVPAQLRTAVERAGQSLRGIELRVCGTLQWQNGRYRLQSPTFPQAFAVRDEAKLQPLVGKNVRLRGRVASEAPAVELEVIEVAPRSANGAAGRADSYSRCCSALV